MQATKDNINEDMYFYYLRDENRYIFGGVCLKKVDGFWCRGISLLSTNDQFDKPTAKRQARKRLIRAAITMENDLPVNPDSYESCKKLWRYYIGFFHRHIGDKTFYVKAHKVQYNAQLTKGENRMVNKPS